MPMPIPTVWHFEPPAALQVQGKTKGGWHLFICLCCNKFFIHKDAIPDIQIHGCLVFHVVPELPTSSTLFSVTGA